MQDKQTIEKWKEKYGTVLKFSSKDDADEAYCKLPSYEVFLQYQEKSTTNIHEATLFIFKECEITKQDFDEEFMLSSGNSIINQIKVYGDFTINPKPQEDQYKKSAALIRNAFQVDPYKLPMNEFYKLIEEALWLQKHQYNKLEKVLLSALASQN